MKKMWVKKIELKNFRNYKNQKIELNKNVNVLYGEKILSIYTNNVKLQKQ